LDQFFFFFDRDCVIFTPSWDSVTGDSGTRIDTITILIMTLLVTTLFVMTLLVTTLLVTTLLVTTLLVTTLLIALINATLHIGLLFTVIS
jgi:hypothetical protein